MKLLVAIVALLPWWMTPVIAYLAGVSGPEAMRQVAILFYALWPPCVTVLALILHARSKGLS